MIRRTGVAHRVPLAAVVVALATGLAGACSADRGDAGGSTTTASTTTDPSGATTVDPEPTTTAEIPSLQLENLDVDVENPTDMHVVGSSLLVTEREGSLLEIVSDGQGGHEVAGTVVDLRDEVGSTAGERGLLGVTTDRSGERVYLNFTRAEDGATVVLEMTLTGSPGALHAGDPRELLTIDQPFAEPQRR